MRSVLAVLSALILSSLSLAARDGKNDGCAREVVIAPGRGADGEEIAQWIARRRRTGAYYPLDEKALAAIPVESLFPDELPTSPGAVSCAVGNGMYFPLTSEPCRCVAMSLTGDAFEVTDLLGRSVFYKGTWLGRSWIYRRVSREEVSLIKPRPLKVDDVVKRNFKLPRSFNPLAKELAARQLLHAHSYHEASNHQKTEMFGAQVSLNLMLLEKVASGEPITRDDIQTGVRALLATTPSESEEENQAFWVIRGTTHEYADGNTRYRIDLGGHQFTGVGFFPDAFFEQVKADDVPARLDQVLAAINAIDQETSFAEAAIRGRSYLRLHPTPNGNCRFSQAVIDFAFLKAGYPPVPDYAPDQLPPFFLSDEEAVQVLLRAYRRRGP